MAIISGNGAKGHHKFTLSVTQESQSIANNTSTISFKFQISPIVTSYRWEQWYERISYTVTINGINYTGSIPDYDGYSTVTLKSGTQTISHNADGNKSISISFVVTDGAGQYYTCGNASGSGTMALTKIPRYATSNQSLKSKTETSITMNWSSDSVVDYIWYSKDNGSNWTGINVTDGKSGSYTISGLSANTTYKVKTRVRRKDSQLTTDSSALSVATYNYPHCTKTPDFTIGNKLTLSFYNPLGRTFKLEVIGADGKVQGVGDYNSTSVAGFYNTSWQDYWYSTIPNAPSGTYKVRATYGSSVITVTGGTYSVKGTETPILGNITYEDTDAKVRAITENPLHIVQNQSSLKVYFAGTTARNNATIANHTFELNGVVLTNTAPEGSVDFGKVNSARDLTLTVTATDSRGLTATTTITVTMLAHSKPTALVTLERLNNYEDETYLTVDGSISSVNNKNTITIEYRYKETGGSYNNFATLNDKERAILFLDKNNSYLFYVKVTDAFGSTYSNEYILNKGVFPLFIDTRLNSIGINTLPTEPNALEIEGRIIGTQNRVLWSGDKQMLGTDTIQLNEGISKQPNGIVLVFSGVDANGTGQYYWYQYTFIPKQIVALRPNQGSCFPLASRNFSVVGMKYLYIKETEITGQEDNSATGTSASGIEYTNQRFSLRYVIGV